MKRIALRSTHSRRHPQTGAVFLATTLISVPVYFASGIITAVLWVLLFFLAIFG
jgi:MFS superfamily sulfate permease-like transporter